MDPKILGRALSEGPRTDATAEGRIGAMIVRYVGAVERAGASLEWRAEGIFLHTSEAMDSARLDPWLARWMGGQPGPVDLRGVVPASALAVASARVDFGAILEGVEGLVPEADRPRAETLKLVLRGFVLGRDPGLDVLPKLGPGPVAYLDSGPRFPVVAAIGWAEGSGLAPAVDNALRTVLALVAVVPERQAENLRVEARGGLTTLTDGKRARFGYRVEPRRVVLGLDPEAVARAGSGPPPAFVEAVRARYFPRAETFAVVDLGRLAAEVRASRPSIASRLAARSRRAPEAVDRDLGQLLGLADLFLGATFSSSATTGPGEIRRTFGPARPMNPGHRRGLEIRASGRDALTAASPPP